MRLPTSTTLKKYGLSAQDWSSLVKSQSYSCPICHRAFSENVKPCIDHIHIRRFKHMKPEKKRLYIRGVLCNYDNHRLLAKGTTLDKARAVVAYLEAYEARLKKMIEDIPSSS